MDFAKTVCESLHFVEERARIFVGIALTLVVAKVVADRVEVDVFGEGV